MNNDSHDEPLVTEESLRHLIEAYKQTIKQINKEEASLPEILMVLFDSGKKIWTDIPNDFANYDSKYKFIQKTGFNLRLKYGRIREAIYIGESWMINANTPGFLKIQPSHHPARQEALVLVGRNNDKSLSAIALQPFSRDKNGAPVWGEPMINISQDKNDITFEGILDYLFLG